MIGVYRCLTIKVQEEEMSGKLETPFVTVSEVGRKLQGSVDRGRGW